MEKDINAVCVEEIADEALDLDIYNTSAEQDTPGDGKAPMQQDVKKLKHALITSINAWMNNAYSMYHHLMTEDNIIYLYSYHWLSFLDTIYQQIRQFEELNKDACEACINITNVMCRKIRDNIDSNCLKWIFEYLDIDTHSIEVHINGCDKKSGIELSRIHHPMPFKILFDMAGVGESKDMINAVQYNGGDDDYVYTLSSCMKSSLIRELYLLQDNKSDSKYINWQTLICHISMALSPFASIDANARELIFLLNDLVPMPGLLKVSNLDRIKTVLYYMRLNEVHFNIECDYGEKNIITAIQVSLNHPDMQLAIRIAI